MIVFLTSSPTGPLDGSRPVDGLDQMNCFVDNLKKYWKKDAKNLIIAAGPENYGANDQMTDFFREAIIKSDLSCATFDLLDRRYDDMSSEQIQSYDVIWLAGGHVPSQNRYLQELKLREILENFQGIVIGISAGSMNSADTVYIQPEEAGEAIDPAFQRFGKGLGLTKTMILPHYQMVKNYWLDGMRLFEDITYGDSYGKEFLALCDGSYLLIHPDGREEIWGEHYWIADGELKK